MKSTRNSVCVLIGCTLFAGIAVPTSAQRPENLRIERMEGHLATPERLEFNQSRLQQLRLPDGFQIRVFA